MHWAFDRCLKGCLLSGSLCQGGAEPFFPIPFLPEYRVSETICHAVY